MDTKDHEVTFTENDTEDRLQEMTILTWNFP